MPTPKDARDVTPRPSKRAKTEPAARGGEEPSDPHADHPYPSAAHCEAATAALASLHGPTSAPSGDGACGGPTTVLDSLVRTILSQNTTDVTSLRAFEQLTAAFPTWRAVLDAPEGAAEDAVRCGGLAEIKMGRVRAILSALLAEGRHAPGCGREPSLEHLRELDTASAKRELARFKGVGPKTASCVLVFALGRPEFPVDTHVLRIARDVLGWVPKTATRESAYEHLNATVPDALKRELHVLLVRHGKCCVRCAANGRPRQPPVGPCPLRAASACPTSTREAAVSTGGAPVAAPPPLVKSEPATTTTAPPPATVSAKSEPTVKREDA